MRSPGRTSTGKPWVVAADDAGGEGSSGGGGEADGEPGSQLDGLGQRPDADFGTLQVTEDGDGAARSLLRFTHEAHELLQARVVAVGEVEPRHVEAGRDQSADHFGLGGGGAERGNDLGAAPARAGRGEIGCRHRRHPSGGRRALLS